ncbi:MAG: hypothetical protein RQ736_14845 [Thiogranum sp.]|nr:hypothetical protein [Thiogranum sp.]
MNPFNYIGLSGLRKLLSQQLAERGTGISHSVGIRERVEQVVDGTDARIRLVSGYQKKLRKVVEAALDYADTVVAQIPPAIEISRRSFGADPYVNAFFARFAEVRDMIRHSSEMQEFMRESGGDTEVPRCYALMCMHRTERTVMGMELSGDIVKRDVAQTAVSFSGQRLYSPAPSEAEVREGLKDCLFTGLMTSALERIVQSRHASERLRSQQQILNARLLRLQREQSTDSVAEVHSIQQELQMLEQKLASVPLVTPQQSLEYVKEVFGNPEAFVRISNSALRLNKMGIKIPEDSTQPGNQLELTEVTIGNEPPRIVTLVNLGSE